METQEIQPGVILAATWGYDQTNASFFKVEKVVGKWAFVIELKTVNSWKGDSMTGTAIASDEFAPKAEIVRRLIKPNYMGQPMIKVKDWGMFATPWNGKPVNVSCYA